MSTSTSGGAQPNAAAPACVHCGRAWSDAGSTIIDQAISETSFKEEEEEEDDDDDDDEMFDTAESSAPILHHDPNLYSARLSIDFSETSAKNEPNTPSIKSPEYESIDFSSSLYESGRFCNIDEIVSYLRELMDYEIWIVAMMCKIL